VQRCDRDRSPCVSPSVGTMVVRIMRRVRSRRYAMERGRVRRNVGLFLVAVALTACAKGTVDYGPPARAPSLNADAVPHASSESTTLDADRVTSGALEAQRLSALLAS